MLQVGICVKLNVNQLVVSGFFYSLVLFKCRLGKQVGGSLRKYLLRAGNDLSVSYRIDLPSIQVKRKSESALGSCLTKS